MHFLFSNTMQEQLCFSDKHFLFSQILQEHK